jgi:[ribosomal protein S18]-alanine N-acetyltransferase
MAELEANAELIREYRPSDMPFIHALDAVCFPADIAFSRSELLFFVNHQDSITRIAELDGKIVGFCVGRFAAPASAHVLTLDVVPGMRRSRIGTALMEVLHAEFCRMGATTCFLEVDVTNTAARRFYEGLQYNYLERLPDYYPGRSDAFRMVRKLITVRNPE